MMLMQSFLVLKPGAVFSDSDATVFSGKAFQFSTVSSQLYTCSLLKLIADIVAINSVL